MNQIKLIIFDFDGTIADSLQAGIKITNKIADKLNFRKLDPNKIDYYKNLSPSDFLKLMKVPIYKIPALATIYHAEFNKIIGQLKPFANIDIVVKELAKHYKLGILSSNSVENIKIFLKNNNLDSYFSFIHSQPHIFGKSANIKRILRQARLNNRQAIYIGDEVRDIQAAKKAKIPIIAVSWGLNSLQNLQKHNPDFLITEPLQILDLLTGKNSMENQHTT